MIWEPFTDAKIAELEPRVRAGEAAAIQRMILLFRKPTSAMAKRLNSVQWIREELFAEGMSEVTRAVMKQVGIPATKDEFGKYVNTCVKLRLQKQVYQLRLLSTRTRAFNRVTFHDIQPVATHHDDDWRFVNLVLLSLDERLRTVVQGKIDGLSDVQIAEQLGVTKVRVGQLRREASEHVRRIFENNGMGDLVREIANKAADRRRLSIDRRRIADPAGDSTGGREKSDGDSPVRPTEQGGSATGLVLS